MDTRHRVHRGLGNLLENGDSSKRNQFVVGGTTEMILHQVRGKIWYFVHTTVNNNNKYCYCLTLILLTWRIWRAPNNASKLQVEFNWVFKGLIVCIFQAADNGFMCINHGIFN